MITLNVHNQKGDTVGTVDVDPAAFGGEVNQQLLHDVVLMYQANVRQGSHQTKSRERKQILERFHSGEYSIVVTSQVLNEGVDVPAANVGIILSGTGSVREHVQRLGRLLRKQPDKQALLYEVVTRGTAEEFTSERRRQHHAYQ